MTIRMDSQIKKQFDKLCQQFGMSTNTAINIFVNQVVRSRAIPFIITSKDDEKEEIRKKGLEAFYQIRKEMEESNDEEISLSEINKEIKLSRHERYCVCLNHEKPQCSNYSGIGVSTNGRDCTAL